MPKDPAPLPVGDIDIFDNDVPALGGGTYWITVTHSLETPGSGTTPPAAINIEPLTALQEMVITAPQFAIAPSEIVSRHPPDASSGLFGEQLPHVVLRQPALPWERRLDGPPSTVSPWLALIVLTDDELIGAADSGTRATTMAIAEFISNNLGFKPTLTVEDDVDQSQPCSYITVSTATFTAVMPRLDELRFLAHSRQANVSDKAAQDLDPNGMCSVVVANRFPARPADGVAARRNIVHLVSLEGYEAVLNESPDFSGHTTVAVLSLASWTFQCLPDNAADFRGLVNNLIASETTASGVTPGALWLRLPPPSLPSDTDAATAAEVTARLGNGFVPLAYHTRTGEDAFAWYRGPLTPVLPQAVATSGPWLSSDAAIAYQPAFGTFDMSLAAAWQAGRAVALSDTAFGQKLLDWRRRAHALTDTLLSRLQNTYFFSQTVIDSLSTDTSIHDEFISVLDQALMDRLQLVSQAGPAAERPAAHAALSPAARLAALPDPKVAVQAFLADPAVQQKIAALVADDLADISQWLARLMLLYPVPFNLLVPDERMLGPETLRFFYLDTNWTNALLDGAMSLGIESSRQAFFQTVMHGVLRDAAFEAALKLRASITGVDPPASQQTQNVISGFLLRSSLVSGWPTLAVRPYLADNTLLCVLRMDHLAPNVLLCLFWGVPDHVELSEPQEGFRFGVDDDGNLTLRNLVPPATASATPLGRQIGQVKVIDPGGLEAVATRGAGSRVLDITPRSPTGVFQTVQNALKNAGGLVPQSFGPAALALQMVKAPEAIRFMSQPAAENP